MTLYTGSGLKVLGQSLMHNCTLLGLGLGSVRVMARVKVIARVGVKLLLKSIYPRSIPREEDT